MKKALLDNLTQFRENKSNWEKLKNLPTEDKEYSDINYQNRKEILIALQFYKEDTDEELIKFLFEEEIKDRKKDPFQGNTESLNRGGFLLSTFKQSKYVWLFIEAKNANFDTHCGFDWEHILSAGVSNTFDYVEKNENERKEDFYDFFPNREDCELTEPDINKWHLHKSNYFSKSLENDDLEFWIEIALDISNMEEAKKLIGKLETQTTNSEESLRSLKYYKGRIKDYAGQIELIKSLIDKPVYEHNIIADYLELSGIYLEINEIKKSWNTIETAIKKCDLSNTYTKGLFSEQAIKIVMKSKSQEEKNVINQAYEFAINNLGNILPLVQLEEYYNCAKKMGDKKNEELFYQKYLAKKRNIDEMMK
jgi:hypothetical protein